MKDGFMTTAACISLVLLPAAECLGQLKGRMKVVAKPNVETDRMGGVDIPAADGLLKMHQSQTILHAAGGKITRVPVEKTLLPHSDEMSPQSPQVDLGPDGVVYVKQTDHLCKSTDGGRTWTAQSFGLPAGFENDDLGRWKVLGDGTFICVAMKDHDDKSPAVVWTSKDEGQNWVKRSQIAIDVKLPQTGDSYVHRHHHRGLDRLQDDTLIWAPDFRDNPWEKGHGMFFWRSTDGGKSWSEPTLWLDTGSEGAATLLPSGKVLSVVRYQRDAVAADPPELRKYMGAHASQPDKIGFKHVFLMDSEDGGQTWSTPRMLTTVYGQTFGYPAAQSDGTVVVIHDTRYGPGPAGNRAMISRDEGKTWLDEVYYLDYTKFLGSYAANVVLEDDTILTIAGSSQFTTWELVRDHTDLYAIRWKPVK